MRARFVSQIRNLSVGIRQGHDEYLGPQGRMVPAERHLEAEFDHDLATKADIEAAKATFESWPGLMELDNGQPFGHGLRVSVFDAEHAQLKNGWSDEETELVVEVLRQHPVQGYFEIEFEPAAKPWNRYDEIEDPDRLVELAIEFGVDIPSVIAYELENRARPQVVEALEAARDEVEEATVSA